jgi:hypothetical protein
MAFQLNCCVREREGEKEKGINEMFLNSEPALMSKLANIRRSKMWMA